MRRGSPEHALELVKNDVTGAFQAIDTVAETLKSAYTVPAGVNPTDHLLAVAREVDAGLMNVRTQLTDARRDVTAYRRASGGR